MIKVNNKLINVEIETIIRELRDYLVIYKREDYFKDIKDTGDNLMVTCPNHGSHTESHPSCGILQKGDLDKIGTFHCFACHYTATLTEAISNVLGYNDKGRKGAEWLEKNFGEQLIDTRQKINLNLERKRNSIKTFVSEDELSKYRFYHPYMFKRKLTKEIIEKFDIGYDKEQKTLTFPVYDEFERCIFVTRRSVLNKYFYIPSNVKKPVYGLEKILKENIKCVLVCESQINVLTSWVYGKPAIGLFGTGDSYQYEILKKSGIRKYILAFDGDDAGDRGRDKFIKTFKNTAIISYLEIPRGKDINDLSREEFDNLKEIPINY